MEETTMSVIGIFIAAILMFIVPLIFISERSDDISQLVAQTATAEFVDEVIKTGKITEDKYNKFIVGLNASGNTYDIDMEVKILDENTAKLGEKDKIGTNTYYSIYTSQIEDMIGLAESEQYNHNQGRLVLKQGDAISVTVKNSSKTLSQSLKSFYYGIKGTNVQIITATASGTVVIDGTT